VCLGVWCLTCIMLVEEGELLARSAAARLLSLEPLLPSGRGDANAEDDDDDDDPDDCRYWGGDLGLVPVATAAAATPMGAPPHSPVVSLMVARATRLMVHGLSSCWWWCWWCWWCWWFWWCLREHWAWNAASIVRVRVKEFSVLSVEVTPWMGTDVAALQTPPPPTSPTSLTPLSPLPVLPLLSLLLPCS
jgi:hypothetical protein